MTPTQAVILDRDGVINFDSSEYIKSPPEWQPIPGSLEAIARLHNAGISVFIATNQAGVARGLISKESLEAIHSKMRDMIRQSGGEIRGIYQCIHHPDDACECRKPAPGMLLQILEDAGLEPGNTPFVGDSLKDIEAAESAGCRPVLVMTGNGHTTRQKRPDLPDVYENLADFADDFLT